MSENGAGPAPNQRAMRFGPSLRRLVAELSPNKVLLLLAVAFAVISVLLMVIGPYLLGMATDVVWQGAVVDPAAGIDFTRLLQVLAVAGGSYLAASLFGFVQGVALNEAVQRTIRTFRERIEDKLHRLPLSYFDRHQRGDLLSRVTNDIDNVSQVMQQTISQLLNALLTVLGVVIMMFFISPLLALVALVSIPLMIVVTALIGSRAQGRFVDNWAATGEVNAQVEEAYSGFQLVRVFGREAEVRTEFGRRNDKLFRAGFVSQALSGLIMPVTMLIGNFGYVAIAVVGGIQVVSNQLSIGGVQAFIQYSRQLTQPLSQIAAMSNLLQSGVASAERIFEILDAEEQTPDRQGSLPSPLRGEVRFEHVDFSYDPETTELITDLNLQLLPGQQVAIVGPTGAGKSTVVNLLMRFYDVQAGMITIDGTDIASVPRSALRSVTGMVLQDSWLFHGTIAENIRYSRPEAGDAEVRAAATAAYVDRFVRSLPDGYDTMISEEADNLSAGEKQLVTIARAFLADPAILILDEATSSVDTRTEVLVQHAMARLSSSRTSFVIAHRLSTIREADLIVVMEHGQVVEQGTHDQLLALADGAYRRLYNAQFAGAAVTEDPQA